MTEIVFYATATGSTVDASAYTSYQPDLELTLLCLLGPLAG